MLWNYIFVESSTSKSNFDSNDFEIKECKGSDGFRVQDPNGIRIQYDNEI